MFQQSRGAVKPKPVKAHTIEDIRYREPIFVLCSCGFRIEAPTSLQLDTLWKYHKKDMEAA